MGRRSIVRKSKGLYKTEKPIEEAIYEEVVEEL